MEKTNLIKKYFKGIEEVFDENESTLVEVTHRVLYDNWAIEAQKVYLRELISQLFLKESEYDFKMKYILYKRDKENNKGEIVTIVLSVSGGLKVGSSLDMHNYTKKWIMNGIKKQVSNWFIREYRLADCCKDIGINANVPLLIEVHTENAFKGEDLFLVDGILRKKIDEFLKSFDARIVAVDSAKSMTSLQDEFFTSLILISFTDDLSIRNARLMFENKKTESTEITVCPHF